MTRQNTSDGAPGAPPAAPPAAASRAAAGNHPDSVREVFWAFTTLALQGFGGVMAVAQIEIVERRHWLSREEFVEEWAVAQVMPGPNIVNLGLALGHRWFGVRGAFAAVGGLVALPLVIVLILALLYAHLASDPHVRGALRGMGAVAAGLIAAAALKLMTSLRRHPLGLRTALAFSAATFVAVAIIRLPLLWVLLGVGGLASVLTWRRIAP